jgi:anti-sigma factor RsiW
MDCKLIETDLYAYTFGTLSDERAAELDTHLYGCRSCLASFLSFKHHLERGVLTAVEKPSAAMKKRLRDEVERTFRPSLWQRARRWMGRPIPFYQGLCAASLALILALGVPVAMRLSSVQSPAVGARIDTSRPVAESRSFF